MDLLNLSRLQLFNELYESKKMIYRVLNLSSDVQSMLSISLSPFLSLLCNSIDDLFSSDENKISDNFEEIMGIKVSKLISQNRASVKLLTDKKISKATSIIGKQLETFNRELQSDYSFIQKAYVDIFGQPDLGVYFYTNIPFANTSQLSIYNDALKNLNADTNQLGPLIKKFSEYQAALINSVLSPIEGKTWDKIEKSNCIADISQTDFMDKDYIIYNDKKRNIFLNIKDKNHALYLFNMQCQLNFASKIIPKIILDNSLGYRIEMIIYYHSVKSIDFIYRKKRNMFASKYFSKIEGIIDQSNKLFLNNNLRSNLYHHNLSEDNKNMEISSNIFASMVEFQTRENFTFVMDTVRKETLKLINLLNELLLDS